MSQSTLYYLVVISEDPPRTFALTQDYVYIGRSRQNDIVVDNPHISRVHARLIRQKEVYILEDLNSTNGTFLNERRVVHPVVLQPGDQIRLGPEVVLRFSGPEADLEPTVLAPVTERTEPPSPVEEPTLVGPKDFPQRPPLLSSAGSMPTTPQSPVHGGTVSAPPPVEVTGSVSGEPVPASTVSPVGSGAEGREIVFTPQRRVPWWMVGCLGALSVACGFCAAWLWWVDANRLWCSYAFFRWLLPGCP